MKFGTFIPAECAILFESAVEVSLFFFVRSFHLHVSLLVSQISRNICIAAACHLITCIMPYHKITQLRLDPQPSACVRHDAWRSEALPVPPAEVAGKGWAAVLESLRVRRVCTQSEPRA